jgi:hypothetical protein
MSREAIGFDGSKATHPVGPLPDHCPICNRAVDARLLLAVVTTADRLKLECAMQCPRLECRHLFIARYGRATTSATFKLAGVAPRTATKAKFSEEIRAVSPTFVLVYDQALAAEAAGLDQIAGIGLRKALEFLVKDFAITQHPDDKETIKRTQLGPCINTYLADPSLRAVAKRAAWLGNDETHYVRKFEDKDVDDLKVLIRLTVNWAENVLLTARYEWDMPEGKK